MVFLRLAAHVAALRYHLRSGFLVTAALIIQRNCAVHSLSSAPQNNKGFVNLKLFQAGAQENMVKSNTPACMQALLRYKGCIAPGELCCSASCRLSFFSPPSLSQSNIFLLLQMHSGLANTFKSESFKQPHLDTQLTQSIDFFIHHILLCAVCFLNVYNREGIV